MDLHVKCIWILILYLGFSLVHVGRDTVILDQKQRKNLGVVPLFSRCPLGSLLGGAVSRNPSIARACISLLNHD